MTTPPPNFPPPVPWFNAPAEPPDPPPAPKRRRKVIILSIVGALVVIAGATAGVIAATSKPSAPSSIIQCPDGTYNAPGNCAPASNAGAGANQPASQVTDSYGETCSAYDAQGYCPGDDPSPSPSPAPPLPPPSPPAATYPSVSNYTWQLVQENPDKYVGWTFTVTGTVTQHDANTGTDEFRADAGPSDNPNTNTIFDGSGADSQVAPLQVGQTFTAKVSVEGSLSYTDQLGGSITVPELSVVSLVIG